MSLEQTPKLHISTTEGASSQTFNPRVNLFLLNPNRGIRASKLLNVAEEEVFFFSCRPVGGAHYLFTEFLLNQLKTKVEGFCSEVSVTWKHEATPPAHRSS